jgi:hypothetical protein
MSTVTTSVFNGLAAAATGSSLSPKTLKAGIVLLDPISFAPMRVVLLQYTPDQLTRSLKVQSVTGDTGDKTEPLRLKGPPEENFKLDAELDATDQLEFPAQNPTAVAYGIFPQLSALESLITPSSDQILATDSFLGMGAVEVAPMEAPFALFVWSAQRVAPVRVTEFSVTEEAFDVDLNPIRAKVSLGLRVLSINDMGYAHPGARYFMSYLGNKEALAKFAFGADVNQSIDQLGAKGLI